MARAAIRPPRVEQEIRALDVALAAALVDHVEIEGNRPFWTEFDLTEPVP